MAYPCRLEHIEMDGFEYLYMADRCNKKLSEQSAVYCFVSHDVFNYQKIQVVYVGKTIKISSRLKYPHTIERVHGSHMACYVLVTDKQDELEIDFIKRYRPLLNNHHNG